MAVTIELGNRRLLKLADYLSELPRGAYDQSSTGGDGGKCAMAHTWDLPMYKSARRRAVGNAAMASYGTVEFFGLEHDHAWYDLFSTDGCLDERGVPARTGKQAAKAIRRIVKQREAA